MISSSFRATSRHALIPALIAMLAFTAACGGESGVPIGQLTPPDGGAGGEGDAGDAGVGPSDAPSTGPSTDAAPSDTGLKLDLSAYCRSVFGSSSSAVAVGGGAYDWRCTDTAGNRRIDLQDACRVQLDNIDAWADFSNVNDKGSWRCFTPAAAANPFAAQTAGIELHGQCTSQYGAAAQLVNVANGVNSWRCQVGANTLPIDYQAACKQQYSSPFAVPRFKRASDEASWTCFTPKNPAFSAQKISASLDLTGYCQHLHGPGATAKAVEPNALGWRCQVGGEDLLVDFADACRRTAVDRGAFGQFRAFDDIYSWDCFRGGP